MSEKIKQTQSMLAKHHGDGGEFAQLMEASYASRFNEQFWRMWERDIMPLLPPQPVPHGFPPPLGPGSDTSSVKLLALSTGPGRPKGASPGIHRVAPVARAGLIDRAD